MFLSIRKYSGATDRDEVVRRVEEGLLPQLKDYSGFIAYYAVDFEDGDLGGVSVYATKQNADDANAKAAGWVKENLAELLPNEAQILRGEVLIHDIARTMGQAA
jgi:hypothetical protein